MSTRTTYEPMPRTEAAKALELLGWSRKELAERAGVDRTRVAHALTPAVPVKIAEALREGLREYAGKEATTA